MNAPVLITEDEFDSNIALVLAASGWRSAACLLNHAALLIDAGDYLGAERNRQLAREQFIAANDTFRLFQEASRRAAISAAYDDEAGT
jgi:hypothetical protein